MEDTGSVPADGGGHVPGFESAGYVLAGGHSSRMGRDKALLLWHGVPLAKWVAETVTRAMGSATLVGSPERYSGLGFRVISDLFPGEGPLGGIVTALRDSSAEWNLIVACDLPGIDAALLRQLLDAAREGNIDAVIPVTGEHASHPLCAVYRQSCRAPFEAAFSNGIRKVKAAAATVRALYLPVEEGSQLQNINTPEDWAAYASG